MDKQVVVIERGNWIHGEGSWNSALLRTSDEKMCCLGFAALACGLDREAIRGLLAVAAVTRRKLAVPEPLKWLQSGGVNSAAAYDLMLANDCEIGGETARDYNIRSEADREAYITKVMGEHGIEVQFV